MPFSWGNGLMPGDWCLKKKRKKESFNSLVKEKKWENNGQEKSLGGIAFYLRGSITKANPCAIKSGCNSVVNMALISALGSGSLFCS